jgi:lysophospholipase L1-like esterase
MATSRLQTNFHRPQGQGSITCLALRLFLKMAICRRIRSLPIMNRITRFVLLLLAAGWMAAPAPLTLRAQTPHDYGRWEPEIAGYERMDQTNPPPKGALLFTGSSTILFWKTLAADFPDQRVLNRGFGGSEITDATHFAPRLIFPCQPRMVLLRAGGNDLHGGKSVETVFADYKEFATTVHAALPEAQIVFIGLSPSIARWEQHQKEKDLNQLVEQYSSQAPYLKYIEAYDISLGPDGQPRPELFRPDKLHFSAEGYKLLAERVRSFLR